MLHWGFIVDLSHWVLLAGSSCGGPLRWHIPFGPFRWIFSLSCLVGSIDELAPLSWSPYIVSMGLLNGCSDWLHLLIIHKHSLNQHIKKAVSTGHLGGPFSCPPAIFPSAHLITISKSFGSLFSCIFSHLAHYIPPTNKNSNSMIWWWNWKRYWSYII